MESIGFIPLAKVDIARREVWGWAAEERPDKSGEVMDYARSLPHFRDWSDGIAKASGGKSLGNVRSMHTNIAAGVLIALNPDDAARKIYVGARIVDDQEWRKVEQGVYTGFSIGGSYADRWPDPDNPLLKRYEAIPAEISLVDNPCMYGATFEIVKADGLTQQSKFVGAKPMSDSLVKIIDDSNDEQRKAAFARMSEEGETKKKGRSRGKSRGKARGSKRARKMFDGELTKADDEETPLNLSADDIIDQLQALRDEAELDGDFEAATLYTQAISQTLAASEPMSDMSEADETPADEAAESPDQQAAEQAAGTEMHDQDTGEPKANDEEDKAMKGVNLSAERRELTAALKAYTQALVKRTQPAELPADLVKAADLAPFAKLADFQKIVGDMARVVIALDELSKRVSDIEQPASGPVLREVGARVLVNDVALDDEAVLKAAISNTQDQLTKDVLISRLTRLQIAKAQTAGNTISLPKP